MCTSTRSANRRSSLARSPGAGAAQPAWAFTARWTAASSCSAVVSGTVASTSPMAGLRTVLLVDPVPPVGSVTTAHIRSKDR
jgi:hypothetical protein